MIVLVKENYKFPSRLVRSVGLSSWTEVKCRWSNVFMALIFYDYYFIAPFEYIFSLVFFLYLNLKSCYVSTCSPPPPFFLLQSAIWRVLKLLLTGGQNFFCFFFFESHFWEKKKKKKKRFPRNLCCCWYIERKNQLRGESLLCRPKWYKSHTHGWLAT